MVTRSYRFAGNIFPLTIPSRQTARISAGTVQGEFFPRGHGRVGEEWGQMRGALALLSFARLCSVLQAT